MKFGIGFATGSVITAILLISYASYDTLRKIDQ
jgi:hypothetical protein